MISSLWQVTRVLGWRRLMRLARAHGYAWKEILPGYFLVRILQTLYRVGMVDELLTHGVVSPAQFAADHNLDSASLEAICQALYAQGTLTRLECGYGLTRDGRDLMEVGRGWLEGLVGYRDLFHSLEALLRREVTYGREIDRQLVQICTGTDEISRWLHYPLALTLLQSMQCRRVLDLGCGVGGFLTFLHQEGGMSGVGIDISAQVVEAGSRHIQAAGLAGQIQLRQADVRQLSRVRGSLPPVDVVTAMFLLHEVAYGGSEAVLDLMKEYRTCYPAVPMLVFEVDCPDVAAMRRRPYMIASYALQHRLSHQRLMSDGGWQALFRQAGFRIVDHLRLRSARLSCFTLVGS